MVNLVKSKIENLQFTNRESVNELNKHAGVMIFVLHDKRRGNWFTTQEILDTIGEISEILLENFEGSPQDFFEKRKQKILEAINKIIPFLEKAKLNEPTLIEKMEGETASLKKKELEFTLLMVEQKHMDYFLSQPSKYDNEPHDRLAYHYMTMMQGNSGWFNFNEGSKLPEYIKADVIEALNKWKTDFGS